MTRKHSTEIKHQLFDVKIEPSKHKLNDENVSSNESICDESDNNNYDSDCSLGSMNSLYLSLKKIPKCNNELERVDQKHLYNNDLSKARLSMEKIGSKIYVSEEKRFYNKIKDNNLTKTLNTVRFYGQQESITQRINSLKRFKLRQLKNKYIRSKLRKTTSSICKFKQRFNKLRTSLPTKHHRKNLNINKSANKNIFKINKKLIRNQLKVRIPLLQFNNKVVNKTVHTNKIYSSNLMQKLPNNETESITDSETILKKQNSTLNYTEIENQLSQSDTSNADEFTDTDDFEDTKVVEDVLKKLYNECDLFSEIEINVLLFKPGDLKETY